MSEQERTTFIWCAHLLRGIVAILSLMILGKVNEIKNKLDQPVVVRLVETQEPPITKGGK